MPSGTLKNIKQNEKSKYYYLSSNEVVDWIDKFKEKKQYTILDGLNKRDDILTELSIKTNQIYKCHLDAINDEIILLKKYFNNQICKIRDNLYKFVTYPNNYDFDFETNIPIIVQDFMKKIKNEIYQENLSNHFQNLYNTNEAKIQHKNQLEDTLKNGNKKNSKNNRNNKNKKYHYQNNNDKYNNDNNNDIKKGIDFTDFLAKYQSFNFPINTKENTNKKERINIINELRIKGKTYQTLQKRFNKYLTSLINIDRNKYSLNFLINIKHKNQNNIKYGNDCCNDIVVFIEDHKNILSKNVINELNSELKKMIMCKIDKINGIDGNFFSGTIYSIEYFISLFLSDYLGFGKQNINQDNYNGLDLNMNDKILDNPEYFVGDIHQIIQKMPMGTTVLNIENILKYDLVVNFLEYQNKIKLKYPNQESLANIEIGFHGTKKERISKIVKNGLIVPNSFNGLLKFTTGARYGNGVYLSPNARFSMHYCRGDSYLLVCATIPAKKYICHQNINFAKLKEGFDSHMANDNTEMVFFNNNQVLPVLIIHFVTNNRYQDWWDYYANGSNDNHQIHRDKILLLDEREKKEYLKSIALKELPYGFGNCEKDDFEVEFADSSQLRDDNEVVWYGDINNQKLNKFQDERYEFN